MSCGAGNFDEDSMPDIFEELYDEAYYQAILNENAEYYAEMEREYSDDSYA